MRFDLPRIQHGHRIEVESAILRAHPFEVPGDSSVTYGAYEVLNSWSASRVASGVDTLVHDEVAQVEWELEPRDVARLGAIIRLDVREMVEKWLGDPESNHGLLIRAEKVGEELSQEIRNIELVIRYGYVEAE